MSDLTKELPVGFIENDGQVIEVGVQNAEDKEQVFVAFNGMWIRLHRSQVFTTREAADAQRTNRPIKALQEAFNALSARSDSMDKRVLALEKSLEEMSMACTFNSNSLAGVSEEKQTEKDTE